MANIIENFDFFGCSKSDLLSVVAGGCDRLSYVSTFRDLDKDELLFMTAFTLYKERKLKLSALRQIAHIYFLS